MPMFPSDEDLEREAGAYEERLDRIRDEIDDVREKLEEKASG